MIGQGLRDLKCTECKPSRALCKIRFAVCASVNINLIFVDIFYLSHVAGQGGQVPLL